jgi:hypothetical protein
MKTVQDLAELLNTASMIINEMVVTESRDERWELAASFRKIRAGFTGEEVELFPIERRAHGLKRISDRARYQI